MINTTLYDEETLRKSKTRKKEKSDRLYKRRTDFERQRLRQIQKAKRMRLTGRPELPLITEFSEYAEDISKLTEYEKHINYVAESCGVTRKDAKFAVDTIGPFYSLISYAYSIYEHNKPKLTFRSAVNLVKEGIVSKELDIRDLGYRIEQELSRMLSAEPPKKILDLPEPEKQEATQRLYGEPHNGDIISVLEASLDQDI